MPIKITYINRDINIYDSFDQIPDFNLVSVVICTNNELISLPDNMNFPNLHEFNCIRNELRALPNNMNFHNLKIFDCSHNELIA